MPDTAEQYATWACSWLHVATFVCDLRIPHQSLCRASTAVDHQYLSENHPHKFCRTGDQSHNHLIVELFSRIRSHIPHQGHINNTSIGKWRWTISTKLSGLVIRTLNRLSDRAQIRPIFGFLDMHNRFGEASLVVDGAPVAQNIVWVSRMTGLEHHLHGWPSTATRDTNIYTKLVWIAWSRVY